MTANEVALRLRVSRKRVYDLTAVTQPGFNRPLPAIRFGVRGLRFRAAEIEEWLDEHEKVS
jgi:excisionase family DNA binding protein